MERAKIEREKARIMKEIDKHLKAEAMYNTEAYEIKIQIIKKSIDLTRNLKTELKEIILESVDDLRKILHKYHDDALDLREKTAELSQMLLKSKLLQQQLLFWIICSQLTSLLKPFEQSTAKMSAETYTTASMAIVVTRGLNNVCEMLGKNMYHPRVNEVHEKLKSGLITRFQNKEFHKELAMSTLLGPRFKTSGFNDKCAADIAKKRAIDMALQLLSDTRSIPLQLKLNLTLHPKLKHLQMKFQFGMTSMVKLRGYNPRPL
ncbi:unnamed protein product [Euphydryas editha]|uniref:Uncharacterized protein n=1 Tax=Euphydryas editha TaxID=104508 RepID=A0AAU9TUZ7_EUPED|nr:unnamed protein product [Euphydryas editha]